MTSLIVTKTGKTADASPVTFPLALTDLLGDGTKFGGLHGVVNTSGALVNPATAEGLAAILAALGSTLSVGLPANAATAPRQDAAAALLSQILSALGGTLNVTSSALPLPSGASTEATLASAVTALNAIKNALLAQVDFTSLFVTDGLNYYVRRESVNEGTGATTVTFETMAGVSASPVITNLTPVVGSGTTKTIEATYFDATANGTGITAGDVLARVLILDLANNTIAASYWHNMVTGAAVTPVAGTYQEQAKGLPNGAATSAKQDAAATLLTAIQTALTNVLGVQAVDGALATVGAKADAAATFGAASASVVALLKSIAASEAPFQGVIALTVGQAGTAGRALRVNCTAAGNITLTYADGSTDTVPVGVGLSYLPGAITMAAIPGSGGATATFANMK